MARRVFWSAARMLSIVLLAGSFFLTDPDAGVAAGFSEEEIEFRSGDATLRGTVLLPEGGGHRPAVALVHGAGPHTREDQRAEAEAFAREGVAALIYDKRTAGYSLFERSYGLLASDALAAARALEERPEVNPGAVGLWGLSEGGWVVPLAASSPEGREAVDFVVLVAASGMPPAQQHSWNLQNELRRQGVSGSMIRAISRTGVRLLVGADMFPEAYHDPLEPLRNVRQPVLALWGAKDRIQPPAESARLVEEALRRGGNDRYEIRVFPDAEHGLRTSPDGYVVGEKLAPGYASTVGTWISDVASGEPPGPDVAGPTPQQARPSRPLAPLAWWESDWVQLGAIAVPGLIFLVYPVAVFAWVLVRAVRGRSRGTPEETTRRRRALLLSGTGFLTLLGFVGYFGYLMFTGASAVGPIVVGRALPWLVLQALAVAAVVFTLLLATSWWSSRGTATGANRVWDGLPIVGGVIFLVWALYWGLLLP